jgi:hypothetical protein
MALHTFEAQFEARGSDLCTLAGTGYGMKAFPKKRLTIYWGSSLYLMGLLG